MRRVEDLTENESRDIAQILANRRRGRPNPDPVAPELRALTDYLDERFLMIAFLTDSDERDRITWLYLQHVGGVDPKSPNAIEDAARRFNAVGPAPKGDVRSFYQELHQITPGLLTDYDIRWLSTRDTRGEGGFEILSAMSNYRPSPVLAEFMTSNHGRK